MIIFKKNAEALAVALSQIYIADIVGAESNPKILDYVKDLADAGYNGFREYKNDDLSWCALWLNWVLLQIGVKGTNSLAARSFNSFGDDVIGEPSPGDIAVFWRISPTAWQGHVALYVNSKMTENKKVFRILGGNQSDQVKIIDYPATQLLSFRRITQ